ncbi:hypothetical protein O1Q82_00697 [Lonepinella sp. MS14437]
MGLLDQSVKISDKVSQKVLPFYSLERNLMN